MADSHHLLYADSVKAPEFKDFVQPFARCLVVSLSTRRQLIAAD
jgi:hypothetical protein